MLVATGSLFTLGVALFMWDFFFYGPKTRTAGDVAYAPATPAGASSR
jgi:hypothetical protein